MFPKFSLSERYQEIYPGVGFGLALINSCREAASPEGFAPYKKKYLRKMRKRETLVQITERIKPIFRTVANRWFAIMDITQISRVAYVKKPAPMMRSQR